VKSYLADIINPKTTIILLTYNHEDERYNAQQLYLDSFENHIDNISLSYIVRELNKTPYCVNFLTICEHNDGLQIIKTVRLFPRDFKLYMLSF
jgi:hypothetical protein